RRRERARAGRAPVAALGSGRAVLLGDGGELLLVSGGVARAGGGLAGRVRGLVQPGDGGRGAGGEGRGDRVLRVGGDGRLLGGGELLGVHVGAGGDRALGEREGELAVLGADRVQPRLRAVGVRGADGQGEGVGEEAEDRLAAGEREVAEVLPVLPLLLLEGGHGPVAHDGVGGGAVDLHLGRVGPVQAVAVRVGQRDQLLEVAHGGGDLGAVPV